MDIASDKRFSTAGARARFASPDARLGVVRADGRPPRLAGYPLVWGDLSSDRGGYVVRLVKGSATFAARTLALYHHEFRDVLGNTQAGTLRVAPDEYGVRVEIDLPDTQCGRDVAVLVDRGDVRGMSFSMVTTPWVVAPSGRPGQAPSITVDGVGATVSVEAGQKVVNARAYVVDEVTVTAVPAFTGTSVYLLPAEEPAPAATPYATGYAAADARLRRLQLSLLRLPPCPGTSPGRRAV